MKWILYKEEIRGESYATNPAFIRRFILQSSSKKEMHCCVWVDSVFSSSTYLWCDYDDDYCAVVGYIILVHFPPDPSSPFPVSYNGWEEEKQPKESWKRKRERELCLILNKASYFTFKLWADFPHFTYGEEEGRDY